MCLHTLTIFTQIRSYIEPFMGFIAIFIHQAAYYSVALSMQHFQPTFVVDLTTIDTNVSFFTSKIFDTFVSSITSVAPKPTHSSFEMKKSGDQFPRKVTTCSRHYKPKLILPLKSVLL